MYMDDFQRTWYEMRFENTFLKKRGDAFQDFFSDIMERCYPGDFVRVRPWGNLGDRKNDGYLSSRRWLFQLYAPNEMVANKAIDKIDEDFHGALPYWRSYFDTWIFTHNAQDGLGPTVLEKLLELRKNHHPLGITHWGYSELLQQFRLLKKDDLVSLFGPLPSASSVQQLRMDDLRIVLQAIEYGTDPTEQDIRPVSSEKLKVNALSPAVQHFLRIGMMRTDLLRSLFAQWHDPQYGDRIAEAFKRQYEELKMQRFTPDEIFGRLQSFIVGDSRAMPRQEIAVLTVLAYFFESCDIFEDPRMLSS